MFELLTVQFMQLVGIAALIAAVVNVLKAFGAIPDGKAQNVSAALSLVAFVAFVSLKLFAPDVDVEGLDAQAAQIAEAVIYILGFVVQMGLPGQFHRLLSRSSVPIIGFVHPYFDGNG